MTNFTNEIATQETLLWAADPSSIVHCYFDIGGIWCEYNSYFYKEHFEVKFVDSSVLLSSKILSSTIAAANTEAIANYITHYTLYYIWLCGVNGCSSQSQTQLESAAND